MPVPEEFVSLRNDWKQIVKRHIDDYPNLKLNRSKNLDKIQLTIMPSPFNHYQEPANPSELKEGIKRIGSYQILVNIMGSYNPINGTFYLGHRNERDCKEPVKVFYGSKVRELATFGESLFANRSSDLTAAIQRDVEAYRMFSFIGCMPYYLINDIMGLCDNYLQGWKEEEGLVQKIVKEDKTPIIIPPQTKAREFVVHG